MIYLTGDTHGDFSRIEEFCEENETTKDDVLIILGDAGINYFLNHRDENLKYELDKLPITLFCIHGNHEERPYEIDTYEEMEWRGGIVYVEEEHPSLLFAKDGEVYDFDGKKAIAIGGAYSVDKHYRLRNGLHWFMTEQPDDIIKQNVELKLDELGWRVDYVLSHTTPFKYEPREVFLPGINQSLVDKTTEKWLDDIEDRLDYDMWYCGHYHTEKHIDRIRLMFEDYEELE